MTATDHWSDEDLMRASDGELASSDLARLEAACAADPALAARRARFQIINQLTREAFLATVDPRDADLARLIATSGAKAPGVAWSERLRAVFAPRRMAIWGAAAAACFVAGLMVGQIGDASLTPADFTLAQDGRIADAGLVRVLDDRLAAEGTDGEGRSVGLTFRDADGRWCRTFKSGRGSVAGLACRNGDGWAMQALAATGATGGELRMAASETPAPVLAAVDALIAGDVLAASDEARARDGGWR